MSDTGCHQYPVRTAKRAEMPLKRTKTVFVYKGTMRSLIFVLRASKWLMPISGRPSPCKFPAFHRKFPAFPLRIPGRAACRLWRFYGIAAALCGAFLPLERVLSLLGGALGDVWEDVFGGAGAESPFFWSGLSLSWSLWNRHRQEAPSLRGFFLLACAIAHARIAFAKKIFFLPKESPYGDNIIYIIIIN